jgi:hypothetical protein
MANKLSYKGHLQSLYKGSKRERNREREKEREGERERKREREREREGEQWISLILS